METCGLRGIFSFSCIAVLRPRSHRQPRLSCFPHRKSKEGFSNMADKNSPEQIPEGWKFETKTKRNGSQVSHYICRKTGQCFYTYEDMMRYVTYAREAGLPVYMPEFDFRRKKEKAAQSSASAHNQIEKSLDSEEGTDTEKSLDSDEGPDTEKSLDSEKGTDVEELDSPRNDSSEKISAFEADTLPHEVEQEPRQTISEEAPASAVEMPHPRLQATALPRSFRRIKRPHPGMQLHPRFF